MTRAQEEYLMIHSKKIEFTHLIKIEQKDMIMYRIMFLETVNKDLTQKFQMISMQIILKQSVRQTLGNIMIKGTIREEITLMKD